MFAPVDFSTCKRLLDIGCGHASDLIALAEKHPDLQLDGYTISAQQAKVATQKVKNRQLGSQINIYCRDSAQDDFPGQYDAMIGFEVVHHIKDKPALFVNIDQHLNDKGWLILADFIANTAIPIEDEKMPSYFIKRDEWVHLLSRHHLKLELNLDISQEVANYLADDDVEGKLAQLPADYQNLSAVFHSWHRLGLMLRASLASYVLLTAQKRLDMSLEALVDWNRKQLTHLLTYTEKSPKQWLYQMSWQPAALPSFSPYTDQPGRWLIISGQEISLAKQLADQLQKAGEEVEHLSVISTHLATGDYRGILYFSSLSESDDMPQATLETASQVLGLIQQIVEQPNPPHLWLVTQEAISPSDSTYPASLSSSALWGLGRTVMWEYPQLECSCLDVSTDTKAKILFDTIWYTDNENQLMIRDNQRLLTRLERYAPADTTPFVFNRKKSYLITGGLGGLGLKVAEYLATSGAGHLILSGRRGTETRTAKEAIRHLETLGSRVLVIKADISQEADVVRLLQESQQFSPLAGIIHAAGVLDDGILLHQNRKRFAAVFAPKVAGSWYLHQYSQEMILDFFVCFSSQASLLGNGGQGNYAAANAFMDSLMVYRQAQGLPGLSINWGGWSEVGLAKALVTQSGQGAISPQQGVELFGTLLRQKIAQVGVIPVNWQRFGNQLSTQVALPVLDQFLKAGESRASSNTRQHQVHLKDEKQFKPTVPPDELEFQLTTIWESVLEVRPVGIQDDFFKLGGDSLLAVELFARIEKATGCKLPISTLSNKPTIEQLAELLRQQNRRPSWSYLVPVQAGGSKPILFLVPPAASSALTFAPLSRHLGIEQPVYSFDPLGLNTEASSPHTTVEEMATHYLKEMCQLQPDGPYLLGGMCFGSHVALEMAQRLQAQGKQVTLLIVLDASAPASGPSWSHHSKATKVKGLVYYFRRLMYHTWHGRLINIINGKLNYFRPQRRHYQYLLDAHLKAHHSYVATTYSGRVALFQSDEFFQDEIRTARKSRWSILSTGGLYYYLAPETTHGSLLGEERHIKLMAEQIKHCLARLESGDAPEVNHS